MITNSFSSRTKHFPTQTNSFLSCTKHGILITNSFFAQTNSFLVEITPFLANFNQNIGIFQRTTLKYIFLTLPRGI